GVGRQHQCESTGGGQLFAGEMCCTSVRLGGEVSDQGEVVLDETIALGARRHGGSATSLEGPSNEQMYIPQSLWIVHGEACPSVRHIVTLQTRRPIVALEPSIGGSL